MSNKNRKTERIGIRLAPDTKKAAGLKATEEGRTLSQWIARLLERELAAKP